MEAKLNISGIFASEEELAETIRSRKVCYDIEPYYITKKGTLDQIGFQINLYGTFPQTDMKPSPDDREFGSVLRDVRKIAEALSNTCNPLHMCESSIEDSNTVSYSRDRKMRADVTVHIPVFDQQRFGHPVDKHIEETVTMAGRILEAAGVRKKHWED